MENWKTIFVNERGVVFEASDEGRIRRTIDWYTSVRRYNGHYKYLKQTRVKGHGTDYFVISIPGLEDRLVHRIIAKAFIPNPNNFPQINHKNGNGLDNRVENLEWCTNRQNALHAKALGRATPYYEAVPIKCVELDIEFESSFAAADFVNNEKFQNSHRIKSLACNIRAAASGKRPMAYGYHWARV